MIVFIVLIMLEAILQGTVGAVNIFYHTNLGGEGCDPPASDRQE